MMDSEIGKLLEISSDAVRCNTIIVKNDETSTPYMLHISGERKPTYVPRIGHRQAGSEDRTMPRITVSTCFVGCFIGYSTALNDFMAQSTINGKGKLKDWQGGFYIHKLPFDVALKPNSKLVYDQAATNEHWLVTYSEETRVYSSEIAGKIIIDSIKLSPGGKDCYDVAYSFFVEVSDVVYFDAETRLEPGYYNIHLTVNRNTTYKKAISSVNEITKEMYRNRKAEIANNLSATPSIYQRW